MVFKVAAWAISRSFTQFSWASWPEILFFTIRNVMFNNPLAASVVIAHALEARQTFAFDYFSVWLAHSQNTFLTSCSVCNTASAEQNGDTGHSALNTRCQRANAKGTLTAKLCHPRPFTARGLVSMLSPEGHEMVEVWAIQKQHLGLCVRARWLGPPAGSVCLVEVTGRGLRWVRCCLQRQSLQGTSGASPRRLRSLSWQLRRALSQVSC